MDRPDHLAWLEGNGHDLAPLTGTLYAIGILVRSMQPSTRPLARELIAYAMDWGDRDRLWPAVLYAARLSGRVGVATERS